MPTSESGVLVPLVSAPDSSEAEGVAVPQPESHFAAGAAGAPSIEQVSNSNSGPGHVIVCHGGAVAGIAVLAVLCTAPVSVRLPSATVVVHMPTTWMHLHLQFYRDRL